MPRENEHVESELEKILRLTGRPMFVPEAVSRRMTLCPSIFIMCQIKGHLLFMLGKLQRCQIRGYQFFMLVNCRGIL